MGAVPFFSMYLLAIETSCDETAAAVIAESADPARPWRLLSNVVASQADVHREWGGVVPELASRQHLRDVCGVVERALALPLPRMTHANRNQPVSTAPPGLLPPGVERNVDFSFSGLKTAVLRLVKDKTANGAKLTDREVADICASFQRVVVESLLDRTFETAKWLGARSLGISGGVSANSRLRKDAEARGAKAGLPVFVPSLSLSTDNAAMIGAAGLRRLRLGVTAGWDLNAQASLSL